MQCLNFNETPLPQYSKQVFPLYHLCGQMFWGGIGVPETVEHEPLVSPNGGECTVLHCNVSLDCITLQCIIIPHCLIKFHYYHTRSLG